MKDKQTYIIKYNTTSLLIKGQISLFFKIFGKYFFRGEDEGRKRAKKSSLPALFRGKGSRKKNLFVTQAE